MDFKKLLDIDDTDQKILQLMQENPEITHKKIGEVVSKSQPAVGARILKLERKGLLITQIGANFQDSEIKLARIDFYSKNSAKLWKHFKNCPFITNVFSTTGKTNMTVEMAAPNVRLVEKFIDTCLRKEENVKMISVTYLINSLHKYIFPIRFEVDTLLTKGCNHYCQDPFQKKTLEEILAENN